MARKDHLITIQEEEKSSKQSFKRNNAILYQAIQPTIANEINGIGATSKTPDEIKDTKFPILNPIDPIGKNTDGTINVDLSLENSPFTQIELSDVGATVAAITINFLNLVKNKAEKFILDITKDPGNVSTPTVTFVPTVENLPAGFPDNDARYLLEIVARETPTETRFEVTNSGGTGSTLPAGTIENQHLEWDNTATDWLAVANSTYGATGPFATTGFLNFAKDQIMLAGRNNADTGDLQFKTTTADAFDMTNSANGVITFILRATDAVFGDTTLTIIRGADLAGSGGTLAFNATNTTTWDFDLGGTSYFFFDSSVPEVLMGVPLDMVTHDITAGGAGVGVSNIGQLLFINNLATPAAPSVYSEGTTVKANTSSGVKDLAEMITSPMQFDLDANQFDIVNVEDYFLVRADNTPRMVIIGGSGASTQVLFDFVTNIDVRFTEALADRFEIRNSNNTIRMHVAVDFENNGITSVASIQATSGVIDTIITNSSSTVAGYRDLGHTADPTGPNAGELYYNTTNDVYRFFNGTVWADIGGGGSAFADNVFEIFDDITSSKKLIFSLATAVGTNLFAIFGTADTYTFPNGGGIVIMSQGNQTIGGIKTFTGIVDLQGNVDLGNSTSDLISVEGRIDTNIDPNINNTRSLGQPTLTWLKFYMSTSGSARLKIPVGSDLFDT